MKCCALGKENWPVFRATDLMLNLNLMAKWESCGGSLAFGNDLSLSGKTMLKEEGLYRDGGPLDLSGLYWTMANSIMQASLTCP